MVYHEDPHEIERAEIMEKIRKLYEENRLAQIEYLRPQVEVCESADRFKTGGGFGLYAEVDREIPLPRTINTFTRQEDKSVDTFGKSVEYLFGKDDMVQKAADFFGVQKRFINYMLDRDCVPVVYLMAVAHLVELKLRGACIEAWRELPQAIPFQDGE